MRQGNGLAPVRWLILLSVVCGVLAVSAARAQESAAEVRTARAFAEARQEGQPELEMFLRKMPKGADLHMHLSGAVYAETFLKDAAEDHLCVNVAGLRFDPKYHAPDCPKGDVAASTLPEDEHLYSEMVDSFSMRTFVPVTGDSGHDWFFDTFGRFSGLSTSHRGEWVNDVATRAAGQNEQYLELMVTPNFAEAAKLAEKVGFDPNFAQYRQKLLAAGIRKEEPAIRKMFSTMLEQKRELEHCGTPKATAACGVKVRFLYQVLRDMPPPDVFAQILLGFEVSSTDPDVVGINLVQPEDGYYSLKDYTMHMEMIHVLHEFYPKVNITLHAGELTMGMVPPKDLRFHIRQAVEIAGAERIGHGVDIAYENHPIELLHEMARKHIMVEINLTSNADILGVKGKDHPFMLYRKYGVPVALSTDDEGVERIDLTHEYVRAAETYPLTYEDMKLLARTSIAHAFLPGKSLWVRYTPERLTTPVPACRGQLGNAKPTGACAQLVDHSQKAQEEWELERRFQLFEASF
jgi:adenosine deaminase